MRGPAVFDLTRLRPRTSGKNSARSLDLTPAQVDDLGRERFYVQLHSEKAPEGNFWGWLLVQETQTMKPVTSARSARQLLRGAAAMVDVAAGQQPAGAPVFTAAQAAAGRTAYRRAAPAATSPISAAATKRRSSPAPNFMNTWRTQDDDATLRLHPVDDAARRRASQRRSVPRHRRLHPASRTAPPPGAQALTRGHGGADRRDRHGPAARRAGAGRGRSLPTPVAAPQARCRRGRRPRRGAGRGGGDAEAVRPRRAAARRRRRAA